MFLLVEETIILMKYLGIVFLTASNILRFISMEDANAIKTTNAIEMEHVL